MSATAPPWVRCPACNERARATKVKNEGRVEAVRLRNGAFLYECSAKPNACGLRIGVFSVFVDDEGGVLYDAKDLEWTLEAFLKHARVVEAAIQEVRENPLGAKTPLAVLRYALDPLRESIDKLEGAVP